MESKDSLLNKLKACRKKYGRNHPKTFKAIYTIVRLYPYYEGYEQDWLRNNENNLFIFI